mgnify:CR=1 FL=1
MKKLTITLMVLLCCVMQGHAVDDNVVQVVYSGTTATVTVASNISSYVTVSSGTSSHVVITQSSDFVGVDATADNEDGEIYYVLSGTSTDGEFSLTGSYKCEIDLNGLALANPSGPALNIQNGKRIAISSKKGTTNTLSDGSNENYKGCIHVKGHTKLKGKGTLSVTGNSAHAIYSKEYIEIKNVTLNITAAVKDGIHCKEYFLMESGTVNISSASDDGIQCELSGTESTGEITATSTVDAHTDEDSGNFYMEDGTLTISNYGNKAIKTDGSITYRGGTQNFDTSDVTISAGISGVVANSTPDGTTYDLSGRRVSNGKGIGIINKNGKNYKVIMR